MTAAHRPHGRRAARMPQPISVQAALAESAGIATLADPIPAAAAGGAEADRADAAASAPSWSMDGRASAPFAPSVTAPALTGIADLPPIGLAEIGERASLMTRTDRKYLVPVASAHRLLAALDGDVRVLEIDDARTFGYRSTYYDTADLVSYRTAATGRRRRFKVRRRDYLDTGASFLEVKTLTGRGQSSKVRAELGAHAGGAPVAIGTAVPAAAGGMGAPAAASVPVALQPPTGPARLPLPSEHGVLDGALREFVDTALADAGVPSPAEVLVPQLRTEYDRTTLLVESEGARLTIDGALTWTDLLTGAETDAEAAATVPRRADAPDAARHQLAGMVVVETKSGSRAGAADRLLWSAGHRPVRISKYATGLALLRGDLAANRWHRTLGTLRAA